MFLRPDAKKLIKQRPRPVLTDRSSHPSPFLETLSGSEAAFFHLYIMRRISCPRQLVAASGIAAATISVAVTTLLVLFAIRLMSTMKSISILAAVAAALQVFEASLTCTLLLSHFDGHGRYARIILFATSITCLFSCVATVTALSWMYTILDVLPANIYMASTSYLLYTAFVLWAVSMVCQCGFFAAVLKRSRRRTGDPPTVNAQHDFGSSLSCGKRSVPQEREVLAYEAAISASNSEDRIVLMSSDTMSDLRKSISNVVQPVCSKTASIVRKASFRSPSLDSGNGVSETPVDDAFDTWDIDPVTRQTLVASFTFSPTSSAANSPSLSSSGRFLETIPASPTGSRSASPGFPLDLQPPVMVDRSRSRSPRPKNPSSSSRSRNVSPSSLRSHHGINSESHIHPLFRTDSPEPPPTTSSATKVVAAPGAGQIISDMRTIRRMRSGSLPTVSSPLIHSKSNEEHQLEARLSDTDITSSSFQAQKEHVPEREMTPPIPEWVLGVGSRNSMHGYTRRKASERKGLGPVGEESDH